MKTKKRMNRGTRKKQVRRWWMHAYGQAFRWRHEANYRQISGSIIFSTRSGEKCQIGYRRKITGQGARHRPTLTHL